MAIGKPYQDPHGKSRRSHAPMPTGANPAGHRGQRCYFVGEGIDLTWSSSVPKVPRSSENKMPKKWSDKDERQYEHVVQSERQRGRKKKSAKEIAARTVNKQRRKEGRTPQQKTQGTGNPNVALKERSKDELYNRARQLKIEGRSRMSKDELVQAIRKAS